MIQDYACLCGWPSAAPGYVVVYLDFIDYFKYYKLSISLRSPNTSYHQVEFGEYADLLCEPNKDFPGFIPEC